MILSGVELYRYAIRLREPVTLKGATLHNREGALIRLTSNDGLDGWGEAAPLPGFSSENIDEAVTQLQTVTPRLTGQEIPPQDLTPDSCPSWLPGELMPSVRFGIESAFVNLLVGCPREIGPELLTEHLQKSILISGLLSGPTRKVLEDACSMREAGYRAVKLKVGTRSISEDAWLLGAVAEVLGDGVSLRVDANRAWGFEDAVEFGRLLSGVGVEYVEEPLARPRGLPELARVWGRPVALDESLVGMEPEDLGKHRYAGAVVLKPTLLGGVSRVLGFMEGAERLGMRAVVSSSYEGGVGTGVLVALAAVGGEPAGLDTYRWLAEDVIGVPLPLPAPEVDVRETMEAARRVEVDRLDPIPLPR